MLTISGDYTPGRGRPRLRVPDVGRHTDRLQVGGTAALDGVLDLVTASEPAPSDTFRILDATTITGTFATLSGEQATPGKRYLPTYDATGVTLGIGLGPGSTSPPSIPASGRPGDAVTCDPGTWIRSPSFTYTWLRDGSAIASGQTYTLVAADGGRSIVCRVTATNANGSADALSNTLVPDPPPPPPPETGETFNVEAERGKVTVRLPNGRTVGDRRGRADRERIGGRHAQRGGAAHLARGPAASCRPASSPTGLFKVTQTKGRKPAD